VPIKEVIVETSSILVIGITNYGGGFGLPVRKFLIASGLDKHSTIIVSDPSRLKTLNGVSPEYETFFDFLKYLEEAVLRISPKQIILTGASGGGHTALLVGHLLKADYVVAFTPYPYLNIDEAIKKQDPALKTMWRILEKLDALPLEIKKYFDLKTVLSEWNKVTKYYVHVSRDHKWDFLRSMYLEDTPNLSIIAHPYSEHSVVSVLSKHGKLTECFELT
jgi:hypothetical protein